MFGAETAVKGLSLAKVLTGINRTLSIANQVIPLYQQAKPMIQNARSAFKLLKEFAPSNDAKNIAQQVPEKTERVKQKKTNITSSSNQPVFFV